MDQPFRSDVECLRAENERLTARVAELEAKPRVEKNPAPKVAMQWTILDDRGLRQGVSATAFVFGIFLAVGTIGGFLLLGVRVFLSDIFLRGMAVMTILALAWCLAFVRRVPR